MENKKQLYSEYDRVVQTIMTNILIERGRSGKFILYKFYPEKDSHRLYFNITAVAADLNKEKIYLDMPLKKYFIFKKKENKKRLNLKWINPIQKIFLKDDFKISISYLMSFIRRELNIKESLYKEINNEYYERRSDEDYMC